MKSTFYNKNKTFHYILECFKQKPENVCVPEYDESNYNDEKYQTTTDSTNYGSHRMSASYFTIVCKKRITLFISARRIMLW